MQATPIEADATLITPQRPALPVPNPQSYSQQPQYTEQAQWPQSVSYLQPEGAPPYLQQQASSYPLQNQQSPFAQNAPLVLPNPTKLATGSHLPAAPMHVQRQQGAYPKQRNPGGCFLPLITVLVVLSAVLIGVWFLALRPYVHGIAENELDDAMTRAVNVLPANALQPLLLLRPDKTLSITDSDLESRIKWNIAPSSPIQNPVAHINEQGIRLDFTIHQNVLSTDFNFPSSVSFVPVRDNNGNIVAHNVKVEGIASLVMSSDEMARLINRHLSEATKRLNHPISDLQLKQGVIDITFQ